MKLVPKLSLAFVTGVSIVLAANGYLRVKRDVGLFDSDRIRDDVLIAETLAPAVETVWKSEGRDRALAMINRTNAREARVHIRWVWLDDPAGAACDVQEAQALPLGTTLTRVASVHGAEERRYTFVRIAIPDPRAGMLEVSESLAPEKAHVRQAVIDTLTMGLTLDAFCVALALLLGAWIVGRPMRSLTEKARRVGEGDFGRPLQMKQNDEMAMLADEMNAMCERLVEAEEAANRAMRARIELLEQLRHADRLMTVGKLASGVAHEIGTPLNVVEARAAMIADGTTSPSESVDYARVIVRATERITRIIRQLLAFARRETAQKSRCDLAVLARHTTELLDSLAKKAQIALEVSTGERPYFVDADAAQIEQVLTNLVMNAIQASEGASAERHGATVHVRIDCVRVVPPADLGGSEGSYARVRVCDRGRGIEPEHLAHVFEPFFTTKDVGQGTGLGLSISYGIIRDHGGWIQAESAKGSGTVMSVLSSDARRARRERGFMTRVLLVDDDRSLAETLALGLSKRAFETEIAISSEAAFARILTADLDVVVTDLRMPGSDGIALCERIAANRPDLPVIVMTGFGSLDSAVAAIRAGAYDFIAKPVQLDVLAIAVERAARTRALSEEIKRLRTDTARAGMDDIVGESAAMQKIYDLVARVADAEVSVLVTGESGTGKEVIAQALHRRSRRARGPFVAINCSAMPEALLESELFGHIKGAFTDARQARTGLFAQAKGGTLFLDEIGDMPLTLQPKILRALQERTVRPIGSNTEIPIDVRVVAATNRDLEEAIEEKRFREDLFFRLNVIQVALPPLRSRGGDILPLAHHFLHAFAKRSGREVKAIAPSAAEKIVAYAWPGNVRELQNCMERAVTLARFEQVVVEDLPEKIRDYRSSHVLVMSDDPAELVPLEEIERRYIARVMDAVAGNKTAAARILGIERKTLYRKIERFGGATGKSGPSE